MTDTETVILVCARVDGLPLLLPDNLTGRCYECRVLVQYRPHAPEKRILRCWECAYALFEPGVDTVEVPPRMIADAETFFRKRRH